MATKTCTIGIHPTRADGTVLCPCGGYANRQCCSWRSPFGDWRPCPVHKCGVRKGCKCPLPEKVPV